MSTYVIHNAWQLGQPLDTKVTEKMANRFYIETLDEYGPVEVDSFKYRWRAEAFAMQLVRDGVPYATVVDRDEGVELARYGSQVSA